MTTIDLAYQELSALVSTRGGVLLGFWQDGEDGMTRPLLRSTRSEVGPLDAACFPLVPFGNRLRDNRFDYGGHTYRLSPNTDFDPLYLHGDGWLGAWSIVRQDRRSVSLRYRHSADADSPYDYEAVQTFALDDAGLALSLTVVNRGTHALPYGLGWHPYFPITPKTTLLAPAQRYWTEGSHHLPDEPKPLAHDLDFSQAKSLPERWVNNMFEDWSGQASIEWPESRLSLRIAGNPALRHAMMFRPAPTQADTDWFCFEPMSHLASGHSMPESGQLTQLAPSEQLIAHLVLTPLRTL